MSKFAYTPAEISMSWKCSASVLPPQHIQIPKGIRCEKIDCGPHAGDYFVDEFHWIPRENFLLKDDADVYGIVLDKALFQE